MAGTQHTEEYRALVKAMVKLRGECGLSQTDLALRLGRNRSYVAKVEICERRLDVIEFCVWLKTLGCNPADFIQVHLSEIPSTIPESLPPKRKLQKPTT